MDLYITGTPQEQTIKILGPLEKHYLLANNPIALNQVKNADSLKEINEILAFWHYKLTGEDKLWQYRQKGFKFGENYIDSITSKRTKKKIIRRERKQLFSDKLIDLGKRMIYNLNRTDKGFHE